jgi:hypothetical protein
MVKVGALLGEKDLVSVISRDFIQPEFVPIEFDLFYRLRAVGWNPKCLHGRPPPALGAAHGAYAAMRNQYVKGRR